MPGSGARYVDVDCRLVDVLFAVMWVSGCDCCCAATLHSNFNAWLPGK